MRHSFGNENRLKTMHPYQKLIFFLYLMSYTMLSYAADSSTFKPMENPIAMHRTSHIDVNNSIPRAVTYTSDGHQILQKCPPDHSLVDIQNASKQAFWGPPEVLYVYGNCSGFGCWCAGSPHSCCAWCDPPLIRVDKVKWQPRPTNNQVNATNENLPSVLSAAGCAPIKTTWERVS